MKKVETLLVAILIIVLAQLAYLFLRPKKNNINLTPKTTEEQANTPLEKHPYDFSGPCPGKIETRKMMDGSMKGLLEENMEYKLTLDYYWCNKAEKGDIVLLRWAQSQEPVVRKVFGVEGDHFQVIFDKKNKNWNLKINDKWVMDQKSPLGFGGEMPPPLKLLETSRKGVLGKRELIVFAPGAFGTHDSILLGVVNLNDVVGKVEAP